MNAILGKGLDSIKFGLLEKEVVSLLGQADARYIDESTNDVILRYNSLKIYISFSKDDDYRLSDIEVYNKKLLLFDVLVFNLSVVKLLKLFKEKIGEYEFDDYESLETYSFYGECGYINVDIKFNELVSVEFGVYNEE